MIKTKLTWGNIEGARALSGGGTFRGIEGMQAVVRSMGDTLPAAVAQGSQQLADDMIDYARPNAPWTDRTGDARKELRAGVEREGTQVTVFLEHGVPYGIYLENRFNGRFAIIRPTMEAFKRLAPKIMAGGVKAALSGKGAQLRDIGSGRYVSSR